MISSYQTPLLISSYDKAMEAFVRLAQFDIALNIDFECEVDSFRIPLAHDDLIIISLMLRKIIEICGLIDRSKDLAIGYNGQTLSIFKIISRVIHSTELDIHTSSLTVELRDVDNPVDYYIKNADKFKNIDPVVRLTSFTDGTTTFPLRAFLEKVDTIICAAVEVAASQRVFLERNIREP